MGKPKKAKKESLAKKAWNWSTDVGAFGPKCRTPYRGNKQVCDRHRKPWSWSGHRT